VADLTARTRESLSAFKVPTRWLVVGAHDVPLLATGKPDKRGLMSRIAAGFLG
jgi:hypothetical protein